MLRRLRHSPASARSALVAVIINARLMRRLPATHSRFNATWQSLSDFRTGQWAPLLDGHHD